MSYTTTIKEGGSKSDNSDISISLSKCRAVVVQLETGNSGSAKLVGP